MAHIGSSEVNNIGAATDLVVLQEALALVDEKLAAYSFREMIGSTEVLDMLLDLRRVLDVCKVTA